MLSEHESEIFFFEFLSVLVNESYVVLKSIALAFTFGLLFILVVPASYTAELTIRPLQGSETSKYTDLNRLLAANRQTAQNVIVIDVDKGARSVHREERDAKLETVSAHNLQGYFVGALLNSGVRVIPPDPEAAAVGVMDWVVKAETNNVDEMRSILLASLERASEIARTAVLDQIVLIRDDSERKAIRALEDAVREYNLAIYDYKLHLAQRLSFLEEQVAVARALNIRDMAFKARTGPNSTPLLVRNAASNADISDAGTFPYYLRGYLAIDEEIRVLKSRGSGDIGRYSYKANALRVKIRELETDRSAERIEAALDASPLVGDDFLAARYDPSLLSFERSISPSMILGISIFLGTIFGVLFVFFRHGVRRVRG